MTARRPRHKRLGRPDIAATTDQVGVTFLGVSTLLVDDGRTAIMTDSFFSRPAHWQHTVEAVGARRVILIHGDDFFRLLDQPLRALPYLGDDRDVTIGTLGRLAETQGRRAANARRLAARKPVGADRPLATDAAGNHRPVPEPSRLLASNMTR